MPFKGGENALNGLKEFLSIRISLCKSQYLKTSPQNSAWAWSIRPGHGQFGLVIHSQFGLGMVRFLNPNLRPEDCTRAVFFFRRCFFEIDVFSLYELFAKTVLL